MRRHDTHDDWCEYAFQLTLAEKALGHEVKALRVDAGSDLGRARTHTVPIEFEKRDCVPSPARARRAAERGDRAAARYLVSDKV